MRCIQRQDNCSSTDSMLVNTTTAGVYNSTQHTTTKNKGSFPALWEIIVGVAILLVIVLGSMFCIWQRRSRDGVKERRLLDDVDQDQGFVAM